MGYVGYKSLHPVAGHDEARERVFVITACELSLKIFFEPGHRTKQKVTNTFYNAFDAEPLHARGSRPGDLRTPFQIDRDRVIYSSAFRSLQSKTQVFHTGEYDFYRTRLTHSLEVAQIGRSICVHLMRSGAPLRPDFFVAPDLVEACCLAHDIGHPPFGHAGESALNEALAGSGGFEGNAQTLRILTDLLFGRDGGMNPTRALLDGVLKYKRIFTDLQNTPGKFLYPGQKPVIDFVYGTLSGGSPATGLRDSFRSIECQIMDWADDIAYGLMDIVDGVNAHFITPDRLKKWRDGRELAPDEAAFSDELERDVHGGKLERAFAMRIGDCILAAGIRPCSNFMSARTNRHAYDLTVEALQRARIDFYKRLAVDLIFRTPEIKQLEYKGRRLLTDLFRALRENYSSKKPFNLLPLPVEAQIAGAPDRIDRFLGDYLSRLTDAAAIRLHRRLFDPAYGSITDIHL